MRDDRFKEVGLMIKKGFYKSWDDIYKMPPTTIQKALKITHARMQKLRHHPGEWTAGEIGLLADLFNVDSALLWKMLEKRIRG